MAFKFLALFIAVALVQVHGSAIKPVQHGNKDLDSDMQAAQAASIQLLRDSQQLNATIQEWHGTYLAQSAVMTETQALLAGLGVSQAELDALDTQIQAGHMNVMTNLAVVDAQLGQINFLVADIIYDLEFNYTGHLGADLEELKVLVTDLNSKLDLADTVIRADTKATADTIRALVSGNTAPEADLVRANVDAMTLAIDAASVNVDAAQATVNASADQVYVTLQVVVDQVPQVPK